MECQSILAYPPPFLSGFSNNPPVQKTLYTFGGKGLSESEVSFPEHNTARAPNRISRFIVHPLSRLWLKTSRFHSWLKYRTQNLSPIFQRDRHRSFQGHLCLPLENLRRSNQVMRYGVRAISSTRIRLPMLVTIKELKKYWNFVMRTWTERLKPKDWFPSQPLLCWF